MTKNTEDFVLDVVRGHRVAASPHLSPEISEGRGRGEPHPAPAWEGRAPGENEPHRHASWHQFAGPQSDPQGGHTENQLMSSLCLSDPACPTCFHVCDAPSHSR